MPRTGRPCVRPRGAGDSRRPVGELIVNLAVDLRHTRAAAGELVVPLVLHSMSASSIGSSFGSAPEVELPVDEFTRELLAHLPVATLLLGRSRQIVFCNEPAAKLLGRTREELEQRVFDDVVVPRFRALCVNLGAQGAGGPRPTLEGTNARWALLRSDGSEATVDLAVGSLPRPDFDLCVVTLHDVSRREEREVPPGESNVDPSDVGAFVVEVRRDGELVLGSVDVTTECLTNVSAALTEDSNALRWTTPRLNPSLLSRLRRCVEAAAPLVFEDSTGPADAGACRTTLVPLRTRGGAPDHVVGLTQRLALETVTEQALVSTKRSLVASERKFRQIFTVSPHPIGITEFPSGRLVEVNDAFVRLFGHTRDQALGKTTKELGIWQDDASRARMVQQVREYGSVREMEVEASDKTGKPLLLSLSGELVELDGKPCLITYVRDVTEQRASRVALAESEERFSKAFLASPDAFLIVETQTARIIEANEAFERLVARTRDGIIGKSAVELGLWPNIEARDHARAVLQRDGRLRDFEVEITSANGETRDCLVSAERLEIGGRWCILTIMRDVTEARRAEEARAQLERQLRQSQKLDALGTLAGGIAHDFNNILAAMLAFAELIKLDIHQPTAIAEHVQELLTAGERAADLVRQILTFSRKQPMQPRRAIRLESTVREALGLARAGLPATIGLEVNIERDVPLVLADATAVHQVVMNLCTNAAYAMRSGQGRLTVKLEAVQVDAELAAKHAGLQQRRYARLTVSDTGEGIPAEALKRVFEPFFTTKGPGEGTGLGMAVVHGIVREHDGVIVLESSLNQGTTAVVYFPEHEAQLGTSLAPEPELPRGSGQLVLVVDDETVLCVSIAALLERLGYRAEWFVDPREALSCYRERPDDFSLVLTDLTMPELTGVELAKSVHALTPHVPIVVMTGFEGEQSANSMYTYGVKMLLLKPLSAARIAQCLHGCLEKARE